MKDDRSIKGTLTLFQGVLNDDELEVLKSQYVYRGRNFATCKITYYTFANEWSNHKHEKYFQKVESAIEWYRKNLTARAILQGACWLAEDTEEKAIEAKISKDFDTAYEALTKEEKARSLDEWEAMTLYCELD